MPSSQVLAADGTVFPAWAADAADITAQDLLRVVIVDGSIPEPVGGAHRDTEGVIKAAGDVIVKAAVQRSRPTTPASAFSGWKNLGKYFIPENGQGSK